MENYSKGKLLGKGSFGSAWLCTSKTDGKNYVVKEVDISRMPKAERESAEQEAKLLMALKHPNIVRCKECFTSASKLCIVMDWCSEGDLYGILQKRKGQPLPEDTVLDWFVQICLGLKHVHDRKILHRDIKSQNIFVSAGGLLKLGDFGVSKVLNSTFALATTAVGTPYYLSPEICQNRKYNQKSDMWSLGCVLYELSTMRQAFEAPNMRVLIQKIIKGAYNPLPPSRSPELRALIASLLMLDARKRPSINDVLAMPVVQQRIARFLSQTLQVHEFSHTVIHGRPEPGHLVVALSPGVAAAVVVADPKSQAEAAGAQAAAGGRIRLSAPPAVGLQGKPAVAPKPAVPRLSGPAIRQQAAPQSAAIRNLRSPSRELLLVAAAAAGAPPKPPSRAVSPSPAAARQQQRSPLVSPKLSPRGLSPREAGVGIKLPSPRGETPAAGGLKVPSPRGSKPSLAVAAGGAGAGFKLPSPQGDRFGAAGGAGSAGVKLPSPRGDKVVAGGGAAAVNAVATACQRAQQAQQERQAMLKQADARHAAEADAARHAAERAYQQRQEAAAEAAAEVARMLAADAAKAAEDAAAARMAAEQRNMEARQQEEQWLQLQAQAKQKAEVDAAAARKAAEDQKARARAEEAAQRRVAEEAQARARTAAEAQRRQAAAEARERERKLMHQQMQQQMQQQKQEFIQRQQAAAANKQRAQEDVQCGVYTPAAGEVSVALAQPKHQRRKAWSPPRLDESSSGAAAMEPDSSSHRAVAQPAESAQPVGGRRAAAAAEAGDKLSAQQRRQVWEEMRAAAQRNKQQLLAAQSPGLAAFLGVKEPLQHQPKQQQLQEAPDMSCKQQQLRRQQQRGNHHTDTHEHAATADSDSAEVCSPWELRRARLECKQAARDAELREFQRQHWLEVKAAAARNKQQVMGELGLSKQQQPSSAPAVYQQAQLSPSPSTQEQQQQPASPTAAAASGEAEDEQGEEEFAAMVADMQDLVLLSEQQQQQHMGDAPSVGVSREVSEESVGDTEALVVAGRFVLDGQEVQLPVSSDDSLGLKVEALRMYLEEALGTTPFLKVYHRLESLAANDDEEQVSQEFFNVLGACKLRYMQLVHQLIIAEERMHTEQMV